MNSLFLWLLLNVPITHLNNVFAQF